MALVVDASVYLKWVLREADSYMAHALLNAEVRLLVPDFVLHEVTNVLWVQVQKRIFSPEDARRSLLVLQTLITPTPTSKMDLHHLALEIGIAVGHSTYDTMYVAFAIATRASGIVVADRIFVQAMRRHPDPALANMLLPLNDWARSAGVN